MNYLPYQRLIVELSTAYVHQNIKAIEDILATNGPALDELRLSEPMRLYVQSKSKTKRNNAFVTINWKPGTSVDTAIRLLRNVFQKTWVDKYHYTFEQRGEHIEELGKGFHSHLLFIEVDKPKSQISREIYNTVKNYVGNKLHVDVRMIPTDWIADKLEYMRGNKWDSDKEQKTKMDVLWRQQNHLETIYES